MTPSQLEWHRYHIGAAMHAATKSKDPSTKVGCVLVGPDNEPLSTGFNGFARGIRETDPHHRDDRTKLDEDRWARPEKYRYVVHAERNAIYNAARHGASLKGATAYLNYKPCCCDGCANALIQVGVVAVVGPDIPFPGVGDGGKYDTQTGMALLHEARVVTITVPMGD